MTMNRLRVATLSLLILLLIAGGVPLTVSLAKWGRSSASYRKKQGHYRKYSRAWWRRYRARQRVRRARALQRRMRLEALRAGTPARPVSTSYSSPNAALSSLPTVPVSVSSARTRAAGFGGPVGASPQMPFEYAAPPTWGAGRRVSAGAVQFLVRNASGHPAGTATLAPVKLPREAATTPSARAKSVGGISVATLRRTVIDRMVAEGGWVTNDYVREFQGRRVFVVLAQTGQPGAPAQSHTFYFTEIEGYVYSLATNAPIELAEPLAAGSEQLMSSLRAAGRGNLVMQK
jgi:hypothetical protein